MLIVYIDGSAGTTGLALEERLLKMEGIQLIKPSDSLRKDPTTRKTFLNKADVAFLCLPDDAAREAVSMIENPNVVVIDASTAHRTTEGWIYGFPELSPKHYQGVSASNRIAVPGCHASGFCALAYPLLEAGLLPRTHRFFCQSLTGYSGGGKAMIAEYESKAPSAARAYALGLNHKHLPEMKKVCGITFPPVFQPVIANVYKGMLVSLPLALNAQTAWECLKNHYADIVDSAVSVAPLNDKTTLDIEIKAGTDEMVLYVFGDDNQTLLTAAFDNLGKGAAGAALQCMKVRFNLCAS